MINILETLIKAIQNSWTFLSNSLNFKLPRVRCRSQISTRCRIRAEISFLISSMKRFLRLKLAVLTTKNWMKHFKGPTHHRSTAWYTIEFKRTTKALLTQTLLRIRSCRLKTSIHLTIKTKLLTIIEDQTENLENCLMKTQYF